MAKFIKLNKTWWKYDEKTPIDKATILDSNMEALYNLDLTKPNTEIVEANDFADLDWNDTNVLNDRSPLGWLDRDGNFYGCAYNHHSQQAKFVHHSDRRTLEKLGWIHISERRFSDNGVVADYCGDYKEGVIPTSAQLRYLTQHRSIACSSVYNAVANGNYAKEKIYESRIRREKQEKLESNQPNNN